MADPEILDLIGRMRVEQAARDREIDAQLNKIHDLVNSQLTDAVNRFRDALKTIEELKVALGQQTGGGSGQAALAAMEARQGGRVPAPPPPPALDTTPPSDPAASLVEMIDATKAMALGVVKQMEKLTAMILDRRAREDADRRADRWKQYP